MPRPLLRACRLSLLAATAAAQDPCLAFEDVAERIACYAAADAEAGSGAGSGETPGWLVGEETDPITDETSVVLRRRAEGPDRDASGSLAPPSLTNHLLPRAGGPAEPGRHPRRWRKATVPGRPGSA